MAHFNLDQHLFPIADALNLRITVQEDDTFALKGEIKQAIGPWTFTLCLSGNSVVVSENRVTASVHIKKDLYAYLVSDPADLKLVLFSGVSAGLKPGSERLGDDAAKQVAGAAVAYFSYNQVSRKWGPTDAFNLE